MDNLQNIVFWHWSFGWMMQTNVEFHVRYCTACGLPVNSRGSLGKHTKNRNLWYLMRIAGGLNVLCVMLECVMIKCDDFVNVITKHWLQKLSGRVICCTLINTNYRSPKNKLGVCWCINGRYFKQNFKTFSSLVNIGRKKYCKLLNVVPRRSENFNRKR